VVSLKKTKWFIVCVIVLASISALANQNNATKITPIISLLLADEEPEPAFELNVDTADISDIAVSEIQEVQLSSLIDGNTVLTVSDAFITNIGNKEIINLQPSVDSRFPLGLNGRIINRSGSSGGLSTVEIEPLPLSQSVESLDIEVVAQNLRLSDFIGIIAPNAVQSNQKAIPRSKKVSSQGYSFRNGAITIGATNDGFAAKENQNVLDDVGDISLNISLSLNELGDGITASTTEPVDLGGEVTFEIDGSLSDLKITNQTDFSVSEGLSSLNLMVEGDLEFDVRFVGKGSIDIGYFSQAWNEVEQQAFNVLGVGGKVVGLSAQDKIGKFPIAGFVWSIPCPTTCPIGTGQTQTPVRLAKPLGVIVWAYLDLSGSFEADGTLSLAKLNKSSVKFGLLKDQSGELVEISSIEKTSSDERVMEVFGLSGEFSSSFRAGLALHADVFALGIRLANVGVSARAEMGVDISGDFGYGTNNFSDPWSFEGQHCVLGRIGAGVVFTGAARLGVEIPTRWKDINSNFEYSFEYPDITQRSQEGRNGLWFNRVGVDTCNNQPDITNGLVAHYKFDGDAEDSSGNNNHGVISGNLGFSTGVDGQSANFDGIDDWIKIDSIISDLNSNSFSLSVDIATFYSGANRNSNTIFSTSTTTSFTQSQNHFRMGTATTGSIITALNSVVTEAGSGLNDGDFRTLVLVLDDGEAEIYVDGVNVGSISNILFDLNDARLISIGQEFDGTTPTDFFTGRLDNLKVFDKVLTADEITELSTPSINSGLVAHYKFDGNAQDSSGNGNHGTSYGGLTYGDGVSGDSVHLDGIDDYISVPPNIIAGSEVTLSLWMKANKSPGGVVSGSSAQNQNDFLFYINNGGGIEIHYQNAPLAPTNLFFNQGQIQDNTLHLYTQVVNSTSTKIYVDGDLSRTLTHDVPVNFSIGGLFIGAEADCAMGCFEFNQYYRGTLDDVRVYNRELGAVEIRALYEAVQ
jgi:hypothetical protein